MIFGPPSTSLHQPRCATPGVHQLYRTPQLITEETAGKMFVQQTNRGSTQERRGSAAPAMDYRGHLGGRAFCALHHWLIVLLGTLCSQSVHAQQSAPNPSSAHEDFMNQLVALNHTVPGHAPGGTSMPIDPQEILGGLNPNKLSASLRNQLRHDTCGYIASDFQTEYLDAHQTSTRQQPSAAFKAYETSCLLGPPKPLDWMITADNARNRVALLAIVRPDSNEVFCGAYVLNERLAATAKHCFYDAPDNRRPEYYAAIAAGRVRLVTVATNPQVVSVTGIVVTVQDTPGVDQIQTVNDFVFISLDKQVVDLGGQSNPFTGPVATIPAAYLAGYFGLADVDRDSAAALPTAVAGVRWSKSLCAVTQIADNGCVYHTCQSTAGFSGAPLFAETQQGAKLAWAGLLTATTLNADNCITAQQSRGNLAVSAARILSNLPQ
jgi:Trypsin